MSRIPRDSGAWILIACIPLLLNDFVLIGAPGLMLRWPWEVGIEAVRWAFCWGCVRQLTRGDLKAPWMGLTLAALVGVGLALAWPAVWTILVEGLGSAWWPAQCHQWLPTTGNCALDRVGWILLGLSAASTEEVIFWAWRQTAQSWQANMVWWVATPLVFAALHWCRYGGDLIWLAGLRVVFNAAQARGGYTVSVASHAAYNAVILGAAGNCIGQ